MAANSYGEDSHGYSEFENDLRQQEWDDVLLFMTGCCLPFEVGSSKAFMLYDQFQLSLLSPKLHGILPDT